MIVNFEEDLYKLQE